MLEVILFMKADVPAVRYKLLYCTALVVIWSTVGCSHMPSKDTYYLTAFGRDEPIHEAARNGDLLMVKALIASDPAAKYVKDSCDLTPLHWAVLREHKEVAVLLLNEGVTVDATTIHGQTPLSFAAQAGNADLAELLLSQNANASIVDDYGYTAAYRAELFGYPQLAERLRMWERRISPSAK